MFDRFHNAPPDEEQILVENLSERYGDLIERAKLLVEAAARVPPEVDADNAGLVADFARQLKLHYDELEKARKAEKEPHVKNGRLVDGFFGAVTEPLETARAEVAKRLLKHLNSRAPNDRSVRGPHGSLASMTKTMTYTVTDFASLPDEYKTIDRGKVQAAIRAGARKIPGLRIYPTHNIQVR